MEAFTKGLLSTKDRNTAWLALDGRRYVHRGTYTVTRAVANDLLFMQYKGHEQEAARLGEDRFAAIQSRREPLIQNVNGRVAGITRQ